MRSSSEWRNGKIAKWQNGKIAANIKNDKQKINFKLFF